MSFANIMRRHTNNVSGKLMPYSKLSSVNQSNNQVNAVYLTQQGRQRELSVRTLRSPLSAKSLESGGTAC